MILDKKYRILFFILILLISSYLLFFVLDDLFFGLLFIVIKDEKFNKIVVEKIFLFKCLVFSFFLFFSTIFLLKNKLNLFLQNIAFKIQKLTFLQWLVILFAISFFLRLVWIILVPTLPFSDFLWYHERAINIVNGLGYSTPSGPTAYWPIGYPAFLATIYYFFGTNIFYAKLANVFLSSFSILFLYFIAKEAFSDVLGKISSLLFAIYPEHISYSSLLCSEIIYIFILLLVVFWVIRYEGFFSSIVSGFFLGIANLIRPVTLLFPIVIFIYFLSKYRNLKTSFLHFLLLVFSMIIVILPWTIRNYFVFNKFVLISTNGGCALWMSWGPYANGTDFDVFSVGSSRDNPFLVKNLNEAERDILARKMAISYAISHPLFELKLIPKKLYYLFKSGKAGVGDCFWKLKYKKSYHDLLFLISSVLSQIIYMFVLFSFIISVSLLRYTILQNPKSLFLFLIFVYFLAINLIFKGQARYHLPMMPFMIIFVSYLLYWRINSSLNKGGDRSEIEYSDSLL